MINWRILKTYILNKPFQIWQIKAKLKVFMDVDCGSGWVESNSANFENYFKRSSIRFQNYYKIRLYAKPHTVIAKPMKRIKLAKIGCSYYLLVIVCVYWPDLENVENKLFSAWIVVVVESRCRSATKLKFVDIMCKKFTRWGKKFYDSILYLKI